MDTVVKKRFWWKSTVRKTKKVFGIENMHTFPFYLYFEAGNEDKGILTLSTLKLTSLIFSFWSFDILKVHKRENFLGFDFELSTFL
jgi:hypothetical protein